MPNSATSTPASASPGEPATPPPSRDGGRWLTRRRLIVAGTAALGLSGAAVAVALGTPGPKPPAADAAAELYEQVLPEKGVNTGVAFGDALQKVIAAGALDPEKLRARGVPRWVEWLLTEPSPAPIVFTRARAPYLVNLLWPIGLSNRAVFNRRSPINTAGLRGFASTGGWTLGRAPSGHVYFNTVDAVPLTDRQAFLALAVATNTFRPCCDNSTFFQDCNHGSALLGLIELAVSQGATADAAYRIALAANSYWFPGQYVRTAQYFSVFENRAWRRVPASRVLSATYSSISGWRQHVEAPLRQAMVALPADPRTGGQAGCGV